MAAPALVQRSTRRARRWWHGRAPGRADLERLVVTSESKHLHRQVQPGAGPICHAKDGHGCAVADRCSVGIWQRSSRTCGSEALRAACASQQAAERLEQAASAGSSSLACWQSSRRLIRERRGNALRLLAHERDARWRPRGAQAHRTHRRARRLQRLRQDVVPALNLRGRGHILEVNDCVGTAEHASVVARTTHGHTQLVMFARRSTSWAQSRSQFMERPLREAST